MIGEEITSFPAYSLMQNVTLYLSLHICAVSSTLTEEQTIQESFDIAKYVQTPASEDSILSLKKKCLLGKKGEDKADVTCMICLESYVKYQSFMYSMWS